MCTYNGAKFIREQLDSIAAQTTLPDELVICDDRSTDATTEIIRDFAATAPFPVHLHVNEENLGSQSKGITHNFEKAVALCTGELLMLCDQDDLWLPEKLTRMAQVLRDDAGIGAVFCDAQLITEAGAPKGTLLSEANGLSPRLQQELARGNGLAIALNPTKAYGCTLMLRASLRDRIMPVPPHWWFDAWVTCGAVVYSKLAFLPETLMHYRIHAAQFGGAAAPNLSQRIESWRSSAEAYWLKAGPQLSDVHARLQGEADPRFRVTVAFLEGRMDLLRFRAGMPANRLVRWAAILPHTAAYFRYFNGWRSLAKDLTS